MDVESGTEIKPGTLLGQGPNQGVVKTSTLTADVATIPTEKVYDLVVHVPLKQTITFGPARFVNPGETEVFNVALVKKGGTGTPVKTDGKGQKEILVYKETISSVDFMGPEYDEQGFYEPEHRVILIHDDQMRRVRPTEGSVVKLGNNPSQFAQDRAALVKPNPQKVGGVSEVNKSGLGGGMVFTMDGITFGVEVCLDHAEARLKNYYDPTKGGAPPASEPKVQIHLIPSAGMSICNPCVVTDGLVFNVDKAHEAAQLAGGGPIPVLDDKAITGGPSTTAYFPTSGRIVVYDPQWRPIATTM